MKVTTRFDLGDNVFVIQAIPEWSGYSCAEEYINCSIKPKEWFMAGCGTITEIMVDIVDNGKKADIRYSLREFSTPCYSTTFGEEEIFETKEKAVQECKDRNNYIAEVGNRKSL